jgi:hypothetical protein
LQNIGDCGMYLQQKVGRTGVVLLPDTPFLLEASDQS